ncbi:hypothetical protein CPSG_01115 [Coccidioides posadasii str. Silveira]|uniref:Uncharacterized protein n=2 Tax=Coccidioides posadasii TaxID=199306 RepID=E9CR84_COCPS|nr:hypothetical protein CPSG_01115 [Coccidioides posadasii str. Silveira]
MVLEKTVPGGINSIKCDDGLCWRCGGPTRPRTTTQLANVGLLEIFPGRQNPWRCARPHRFCLIAHENTEYGPIDGLVKLEDTTINTGIYSMLLSRLSFVLRSYLRPLAM